MMESSLQALPPLTESSVFHDTLETPSWLLTPATGAVPPPPVTTRMQLLPFSDLSWENFERLCLRMLRIEVGAVRASLYGRPGQAQYGIDMFAIAPAEAGKPASPRGYVTLQSRRIGNVTASNIENSVNDFLQGEWADVTRKFIYATSSPVTSNQTIDKIEKLVGQLDSLSIAFEVWDQEIISEKLRILPELVDDFFGRPWVSAFCGEDVAEQLGIRLDVNEMAELRQELGRIYAISFGLADPGFAGFGPNELRRVELVERFVTPDLVSATHQSASYPYDVAVEDERVDRLPDSQAYNGTFEEWNARYLDEYSWSIPTSFNSKHMTQPEEVVERRPANHWIGSERLQIVIGDPGAGKSFAVEIRGPRLADGRTPMERCRGTLGRILAGLATFPFLGT